MGDLSKTETEQLVTWLQTKPTKNSPLTPELEKYYERLQFADRWMREHMSVAVVWPMLANQFGYSEATARRDIYESQVIFGSIESHPKQYYAKMMIDKVGEAIIQAMADRKWRELATLSKEMREWVGFAEEAGVKDPKLLLNEVPRLIAFSPELLGVERNPHILEEAKAIIEQKLGKPFDMPHFPDADGQTEAMDAGPHDE